MPKGGARLCACCRHAALGSHKNAPLGEVLSSSLDDMSPRTDGSKETSVEATRATPCQQQVLRHSGTALGMQLSMRRVCGDGAIDVGGAGVAAAPDVVMAPFVHRALPAWYPWPRVTCQSA